MACFTFRNARVLMGSLDVSGDLNEVVVTYDLLPNTVMGAGSHSHAAGGISLEMSGYVRAARGIWKKVEASRATFSVSQRSGGKPLVFVAAGTYTPGAMTGQLLAFTVEGRDGSLVREKVPL